jgi:phosphoenolpyruvate---glycerone phosphotransferase subunit DhaL
VVTAPTDRPLRARILDAADAVEAARDELCRLDAAAGDGDHGVTMALAARAVRARLEAAPDATGSDLVTQVALGLGSVGGAIGPIHAAGLLRVAAALRPMGPLTDVPTVADLATLAEAYRAAIVDLGKATPGDKTILDAVAPMVDALRGAVASGEPLERAIAGAVQAADAGAQSTAAMIASLGRASRLGERSRGTADPGATSFALILAALADPGDVADPAA